MLKAFEARPPPLGPLQAALREIFLGWWGNRSFLGLSDGQADWSEQQGVDFGSHLFSNVAGTPVMEIPTKSSGHTDQGIMKKSKGFDGLVMSIGNSNANSSDSGAHHMQSQRLVLN
ncbi:hypothetical protein Vadar_013155 [Vaccinium darrowii]|uniref:Uncharacterized protein n=1 Tax=Vaccinium darrowii TaxID=229202 RepID=A0ACB7YV67_9ERIC|nr:hypothetical protein Vadar_013155 [Vaccinium darrowii]